MKTKITLLPILIFLVITLSSVTPKRESSTAKVIVYGIVYVQECNFEAFGGMTYNIVEASSYKEAQRTMEASLKTQYPNAKRIRISSSRYDYGKSATNMCIIRWESKMYKCSYEVVSIYFGKTEAEALNTAIEEKNAWAGKGVSYSIIKQVAW